MKTGGAAIACAAVVGAAGVWALAPLTSPSPAKAAPSVHAANVRPAAGSDSSVPTDGRLFLTRDQLAQAMASGTLQRPVKSLLAVRMPLRFGEYRWNDSGVPAGPTWIRVDLESQLISVFRAGHEIGTAVIVYGGDNKETPAGTLHVLARNRDHRSSIYDADMPYTLRLTNDGVSIHASDVRSGAATHGCIGVPIGFAERLFDAARVGDEVIIVPADARRSA